MSSKWLTGEIKNCYASTNQTIDSIDLDCSSYEAGSEAHSFPVSFYGNTRPTFAIWQCQRGSDGLACSLP